MSIGNLLTVLVIAVVIALIFLIAYILEKSR